MVEVEEIDLWSVRVEVEGRTTFSRLKVSACQEGGFWNELVKQMRKKKERTKADD